MTFYEFAQFLHQLENTTSRNVMVEILADLFGKTTPTDIEVMCYLLQGRVVPLYTPLEFGVADKMMMRAIALGLGVGQDEVLDVFKKTGDLGITVEQLKTQNVKRKTTTQNVKLSDVFENLLRVAQSSGEGSQEEKVQILSDLIKNVDSLSARYIVRIPLGKLRLGFSDMTILEGLSWMFAGTKEHKDKLEAAYNMRPDLGALARMVKEKGITGISHITPVVGTPILMARANRLSSEKEIIEKIGTCAIEYKYDGLRLQVHYAKKASNDKRPASRKTKQESLFGQEEELQHEGMIKMFSRNLEDVTRMFPDIAAAIGKQITAESFILEGEVVAYNPETGVFVPFQETMQRKRKYDIGQTARDIPVKLFAFEILYKNGKSLLNEPYEERKKELRSILKHVVGPAGVILYAQETITDSKEKIEELFKDSVAKHFEGIIAKKLDGRYEAGMRGWNWIKFKKAMNSTLSDTVDVVVMGYTKGEGKRTSFGVGQFLTGVYDEKQDRFVTVSKIGTGLTDEQFKEFMERVKKLEVKQQPKEYELDKLMMPDVFLKPSLVVETGCDEITRSAVHTAGRVMEPSKSGKAFSVQTPGFALRFPRLIQFRDDRTPTDATTVEEVESLFRKQKKI